MGRMKKQVMGNQIQKGIILLFILFIGIILMGCTSSRKEELHEKLQEGEVLLQKESFDEALQLYTTLLEDYQDNLTVMEKIEFSSAMKSSRENLILAKKAFQEESDEKAIGFLKKLSEVDQKAQVEKEELLKTMKEKYLLEADTFLSENSFEKSLEVLSEYENIMGKDEEITNKIKLVTAERKKPVEIIKKVIVIDAAHQEKPNLEKEPIAPGSEVMRSKVGEGTQGVESKVPEYVLNLDVAKLLKQLLVDAGYQVYLTRDRNEINLSNIERSQFSNEMKADLFIRLHGNGSNDSRKSGIEVLYPSEKNEYVGRLSMASGHAATAIHDELLKVTDAKTQGALAKDNMPEHNFSEFPVVTVLYGYMTNQEEDILLQTKEYQQKVAEGLKNGIIEFLQVP